MFNGGGEVTPYPTPNPRAMTSIVDQKNIGQLSTSLLPTWYQGGVMGVPPILRQTWRNAYYMGMDRSGQATFAERRLASPIGYNACVHSRRLPGFL